MSEQQEESLSEQEKQLLELLLYMTGREERLKRRPLVEKQQLAGIRAIWPILVQSTTKGMESQARCDLLNRLLLTLGIKTVSVHLFEAVFSDIDFSKFEDVRERATRFRILCMLEYGSLRFGYKQFREDPSIGEKWKHYFPSKLEVMHRVQKVKARLEPVGLIDISASQLFSLGYLASEHAPSINTARESLLKILEKAISLRAADFSGLQRAAEEVGEGNLTSLLAKAGIPGTETLIYSDTPLFGAGKRPYPEVLRSLHDYCATIDESAIAQARDHGFQNARTYMAMHDLDVYVATSMRDPLHFTTNWAFVHRLFHEGALADWKLRYFDPTQVFLA
ncbi:MAG: hypothetical protein MN733_04440, partial [Nitrososphaera sp.]|nr:hypothetical protein [Nitrososphaera sp.]